MELYRKHRPKNLSQVIGQDKACKMLSQMAKTNSLPHALLLHGPSGVGKTTIARILRRSLRCSKLDFVEVNCADFRGIDMIREIRSRMMLSPMGGDTRIWLIDEAHQLSSQAQNAFLKMLEDTPNHVYFLLATTHPQKLLKTIRTRCTDVPLKLLTNAEITIVVQNVYRAENLKITKEVGQAICKIADGSPRQALVLLGAVAQLETAQEQLEWIQSADTERQAIEIARTLIRPGATWPQIAKLLKEVEEDPESLRWMVLGYANTVLLGGGKIAPKAALIIEAFRDNFYDSKKAGLTAACWEVLGSMKGP